MFFWLKMQKMWWDFSPCCLCHHVAGKVFSFNTMNEINIPINKNSDQVSFWLTGWWTALNY